MSEPTEPVLTVERILELWLADCGEQKCSPRGTTYLVIPLPDRRGRLLDLIQTLVSFGYKQEDIRTATVSNQVVKMCWSDLIVNMTAQNLRKCRDISRKQWEGAIDEFFSKDVELPKYEGKSREPAPIPETKAKATPKEKTLEELKEEIFNPKNRIVSTKKFDRSADTDWELLAELGIEPDKVDNE